METVRCRVFGAGQTQVVCSRLIDYSDDAPLPFKVEPSRLNREHFDIEVTAQDKVRLERATARIWPDVEWL